MPASPTFRGGSIDLMDTAFPTSRKPRPGDLLELHFTDLTPRGAGFAERTLPVGTPPQDRRFQFHVNGALPGDVGSVRVRRVRRGVVDAFLESLITPSPDRIDAPCAHFRIPGEEHRACGGCTLQSWSHEQQLQYKVQMTRNLLEAQGLDSGVLAPPLALPEPWRYRNKMELSFGRDADGQYALGMHPPGRKYDIVVLEDCHLMRHESAQWIVPLRDWARDLGLEPFVRMERPGFLRTLTIREGFRTGERMLELTTTGDESVDTAEGTMDAAEVAQRFLQRALEIHAEIGAALTSVHWTQHHAVAGTRTRFETRLLHGAETLAEELHVQGAKPLRFRIHPRAFFQPNSRGAELLYGVVRELALQGDPPQTALDLYCGTGTIGMVLASHVPRVIGVELNEEAVANARTNANDNALTNLEFHAGDVGEVLAREGLSTPGSAELVVVDPPRSGLFPAARAQLKTLAAPRMIYVSCNPRTLATDLADLVASGWQLESIHPVDMFPQTMHLENVVLLTRNALA